MKEKILFLVFAVSNMLIGKFLLAQIASHQIDSLMTTSLEKLKIAGAAVAVVKDGRVIFQKGYGITSIENPETVNEFTNFQIASNSKAFTATALSILVDEKKLKWTDKVKDYIPEFKMYNEYVTDNFNIVDLLSHRSGLGIGVGDLMFIPDGSDFTVKDVISSFQHFKPQSAFRTRFDYDNLLYIVAGEVIARVSGMSYECFIKKRIFTPLKMDDSFIGRPEKNTNNLALPHSSKSGTLKKLNLFDVGMISPAGGIYSNIADMSKWMILQLNRGKYGPELKYSLYSPANSNKMWTIQTVLPVVGPGRYNTHFKGYGLGWILFDVKGKLEAVHTGGLPGMESMVTLVPDLNLGIVVLNNTSNGSLIDVISTTILDSYLGMEMVNILDPTVKGINANAMKIDETTKRIWAKVDSAKNTKIQNENYIGIYEDKWFGKVEVFLNNDKLWIKSLRSPKLNGPLAYYNANTFAIKWEYQDMNCDAFALFSLDEDGMAQSIRMKGISPTMDFSFDFHDLDLRRINKK